MFSGAGPLPFFKNTPLLFEQDGRIYSGYLHSHDPTQHGSMAESQPLSEERVSHLIDAISPEDVLVGFENP